MSDLQEHITSVRATLDELEAALRAVDTARPRYHEVAGGLEELDAGHNAAPRGASLGVEE